MNGMGNQEPNTDTIASRVTRALASFRGLVEPAAALDFSEPWIQRRLHDENTKLRVWSGSIGAHKTGIGSLDFRLRDASHIRKQVKDLLDELCSLLRRTAAIAAGEEIPWDQLDDEEPLGDADWDGPSTEMGQIVTEGVADALDCLFRLTMAIRTPAPHDRFAKLRSADAAVFEPFDIRHVESKWPTVKPWLAERLGRALSRRREYFRYRESHHAKLSRGLDDDDTASSRGDTKASSIPGHLKDKGADASGEIGAVVLEDDRSDTGASQTSYATSLSSSDALGIPKLPKEARDGPFQCKFCYMIIVAEDRLAWRKHIYSDLGPYICLERDCITPGQQFSRRHHWMDHTRKHHWVTYVCLLGCNSASFGLPSEYRKHISREHPGSIPEADIDAMVNHSAQPRAITKNSGLYCPLCGDKEPVLRSEKQYQRHVGRHQEQLSLFALPQASAESDNEPDSDSEYKSDDDQPLTDVDMSEEILDEQRREHIEFLERSGGQSTPQTETEITESVERPTTPIPFSLEDMLGEERRQVLELLQLSEDIRTASTTLQENVLKDTGVSHTAPTLEAMAPQPAEQQTNEQLLPSVEQYNGLSSQDFPPGAPAENSMSQGRRNLAEALAKMRNTDKQPAAEAHTRSLLWDQIPSEVVRKFAKMIAESNAEQGIAGTASASSVTRGESSDCATSK